MALEVMGPTELGESKSTARDPSLARHKGRVKDKVEIKKEQSNDGLRKESSAKTTESDI